MEKEKLEIEAEKKDKKHTQSIIYGLPFCR